MGGREIILGWVLSGWIDGVASSAGYTIKLAISLSLIRFQRKPTVTCAFLDIKSVFDTAWFPANLSALIKSGCHYYPTRMVVIFFLANERHFFPSTVKKSRKKSIHPTKTRMSLVVIVMKKTWNWYMPIVHKYVRTEDIRITFPWTSYRFDRLLIPLSIHRLRSIIFLPVWNKNQTRNKTKRQINLELEKY